MAANSSEGPDLIELVVENERLQFSKSLLMKTSRFFYTALSDGLSKKTKIAVSGVRLPAFKELLAYMETGKLELSCNNVADIFHTAWMLQMPDIIKRCIKMEEQTSPIGRQIILYKAAKQMHIPEEKNTAFSHLVSNFLLAMGSKEYLELDVKDVLEILSANVLGCRGEMDVFTGVCRWINHDVKARLVHASRLMYCVRFPLMNLRELDQCLEVSESPLLREVKSLRVMILSAICYWISKATGKETDTAQLARKPRQYTFNSKQLSSDVCLSEIISAMNKGSPARLEAPSPPPISESTVETDVTSEIFPDKQQFFNVREIKDFCKREPMTPQVNRLLDELTTESEEASQVLQSPKSSTKGYESDSTKTMLPMVDEERNAPNVTSGIASKQHESHTCQEESRPSEECDPKHPRSPARDMTQCVSSHRNEKGDWKGKSLTSDLAIHPDPKCAKDAQEISVSHHAAHNRVATAPASVQTCECELGGLAAIDKVFSKLEMNRKSLNSRLKCDGEQGSIFLIGGVERDPAIDTPSDCPILSYDLETDTWTNRKTLPVHRYGHKAAYLDGYIYVVGGFENFSPVNLEKTSSRCCFWYEVLSGRWGIMAPLINTRAYHGLAILDNTIYAVGGVDSNNRLLSTVERYDRSRDEWVKLSNDLYSPRMAMGTCGHRDQLWVAGGIVQIGRRTCSTAYVEVYNPEAQRWAFAVNFLPSPRSCLSLVDCDGTLYAIGGLLSHRSGKRRNFTTLEDVLVLVDERNIWVEKASMPAPRHSMVTATHDGLIFVMGGRQAEKPDLCFDAIVALDTKMNQWLMLGGAPKHLTDYHCVLIPPKTSWKNFRDNLRNRGDERACTRTVFESLSHNIDNKCYSQGDVATLQMHMSHT